jgi:hypothetical protein
MATEWRLRLLLLCTAVLLCSGCGLFAPIFGPVSQTTTTNVDQNRDEGYIRFSNIGSAQEILLDGTSIGMGAAYRDGGQLAVSPGPHDIEIRDAGVVRLQQKVFIGTGSTRTIEVR